MRAWAAAALLATACGPTHGGGAAEGRPDPATDDASRVAGVWTSDGCGERDHQRLLSLASDGGFALEDFVAPCPPNADCVWSGILRLHGRWHLDADRLRLEPDPAAGDPPPIAPPDLVLHHDPAGDLHLAERDPGGALCPYRRGAAAVRADPAAAAEPAPAADPPLAPDEAPLPVEGP